VHESLPFAIYSFLRHPQSFEACLFCAILNGGDRDTLGLFWGVGREPPDDGESELALIASQREGVLEAALLAGPGRDLYPPLLPLTTLPNMALAHVSINLGIGGENGAWAGRGEAALVAARAAWWAVTEGRCPAALVGGAESQVDLGSARDRLRAGGTGAPGEAAASLLLEPVSAVRDRGGAVLATVEPVELDESPVLEPPFPALGDCGAGNGALDLVLAVAAGPGSRIVSACAAGAPPIAFRVTVAGGPVVSSSTQPS